MKAIDHIIVCYVSDGSSCVLVFCNVTNKIRKRTDTAVVFTQEYSRVLYALRNVSTLSMGLVSSKDTHVDVEKTEERAF